MKPKLVQFPLNGVANSNHDAAVYLRKMADDLEGDDVADVRSIIIVSEFVDVDGVRLHFIGKPLDNARAAGVLGIAYAQHMKTMV